MMSKRALTLAELLIAAGILAVALVGLLALFVNCIFLNESNRNRTVAMTHTQLAMEEVKNTLFSSVVGTYNGVCWYALAGTLDDYGLTPLSNEQICFTAAAVTADELQVTVTTSWSERSNLLNRSMVLETLITEP